MADVTTFRGSAVVVVASTVVCVEFAFSVVISAKFSVDITAMVPTELKFPVPSSAVGVASLVAVAPGVPVVEDIIAASVVLMGSREVAQEVEKSIGEEVLVMGSA